MTAVGLNAPDTVAKYGRATVHSLRHTFASWLIQNGADLGEVAGALSHASLNMTKRYAHLSKGATLAKLGGILNDISVGGTRSASRAITTDQHSRRSLTPITGPLGIGLD